VAGAVGGGLALWRTGRPLGRLVAWVLPAVALMQVRDFRPKDFAQFHPGGELGKRLLTTAEDVMRSNELPVIPQDMHLGEAIIHVSKGKLGLGVALIDNKVTGLITDGDIRRAMERWRTSLIRLLVI